jgi:hypothetical protein
MYPTTRNEAIAQGRNKYWTGRPCPKGHVAERYVQSSACTECVRNNAYASRKGSPTAPLTPDRVLYIDTVRPVRVRVPLRDLDALRDMAAALLMARFPTLASDARVKFRPDVRTTAKAGGTAMVHLPAHADDAATVRAIADAALERLSEDNLASRR